MLIDVRIVIILLNTSISFCRKIKETILPPICSYITLESTESKDQNVLFIEGNKLHSARLNKYRKKKSSQTVKLVIVLWN